MNTPTSFPSTPFVGRGTSSHAVLAHSVPIDEYEEDHAVPTNEQRRETAKRKLERQLERRAAQERKRRLFTIIGSVVGVLVVIGAVVATVVLTNKGPGTNGSQFFLVWDDSPLGPDYTVFGTMDKAGRDVVAAIASQGQDGSYGDGTGKPNAPATIETVTPA